MSRLQYVKTNPPVQDSQVFIDGDTLVLTLSPSPDFQLCSNIILFELGSGEDVRFRNVLVDCSQLKPPRNEALQRFVQLGRKVINKRVRLLLLDAHPGLYRRMRTFVPDAIWIDSDNAGTLHRDTGLKRAPQQ